MLVDLPDFAQTSDFNTTNDCNCNETTDHHCGLKHVSPHHSLQSTLTENQKEGVNRLFPSSLVPLFQSGSKCETILNKMTLICMKMKLHVELIFI